MTWPIHRGVNLLYGQNGAGKSTLLERLRNALLVDDPTVSDANDSLPDVEFHFRFDAPSKLLDPYPLWEMMHSVLLKHEWAGPTDDFSEPIEQLVAESYYCQTPGSPSRVWLVASPDGERGRQYIQDCRRLEAEIAALYAAHDSDFYNDDHDPADVSDAELNEVLYKYPTINIAAYLHQFEMGESLLPSATPPWFAFGFYRANFFSSNSDGLGLPVIGFPVTNGSWASYKPRIAILPMDGSDLRKWTRSICPKEATSRITDAVEADRIGEAWAANVTASANRTLGLLMQSQLKLQLEWNPISGESSYLGRWEEPCTWRVREHTMPQHYGRPLTELSKAEHRWATTAALWSMPLMRDTAPMWQGWPVAIIDEPEEALHRNAERHLAEGIQELADSRGISFILATHSPIFLDLPGAHVSWVRDGVPHAFDGVALENLDRLGLQVSDLLSMTRAVLLVEGVHDKLLVETFVGRELRRLSVMVVPLHGGKNLAHALDSQVLFDYTDATLIGMLDNLDPNELNELWAKAVAMESAESPEAAADWLRSNLPSNKANEYTFLKQWLTQAVTRGESRRVVPTAMSKPDILDYLSPVDLLSKSTDKSWDELRKEWQHSTENAKQRPDFKTWLRKNKGADLSEENITRAASKFDNIPEDFLNLLRVCEETVRRSRTP